MTSPLLLEELRRFDLFGAPTREERLALPGCGALPLLVNEFWTAKQRSANNLHEISYRACFKPQLPRFFIERLTSPGETVLDPFMGRGTTPLEAALLDRVPLGNDANPLGAMMLEPRLDPPACTEVEERLRSIGTPWEEAPEEEAPRDLLVFYHSSTLARIAALRRHLLQRARAGTLDAVDRWIRMVSINRLTGHAPGFFSVYTLPPNQAVSVESQRRINAKRKQEPPPRDVDRLILKKTRALLADCDPALRDRLGRRGREGRVITGPAASMEGVPSGSVALVVTSPPFLHVVNYALDNWLRNWFGGIDPSSVALTVTASLPSWCAAMTDVFRELRRVLEPGGEIAFEVGEVRAGTVRLEESVVPCGMAAGLEPLFVMVNEQHFTKTAHCWGVSNRSRGTNTNRIVVFRKG